ncbi:MAG: undecaprenyl-diphosphate phosphatase [Acidimicrobiales bacterium]
MTYLQAVVIGIIQGVAELFPISSLGHTVIIPAFIGGSWSKLVTQQASSESPYLAFVVGLHVATALALIVYFWRDWVRIVRGFFSSLVKRRVETTDERASWFIVIATIPVGVLGIALEHQFRTLFAKPYAAADFLAINGLILLGGEWLRRRAKTRATLAPAVAVAAPAAPGAPVAASAPTVGEGDHDAEVLARLGLRDAIAIGFAQSLALFAGISRDGICMVSGLFRGLTYEDAARFAFLLSAPPILAAGLLKIPDLFGTLGHDIRGQVVAGSVAAFLMALFSVRFLVRYFRTRGLWPFAIYCLAMGISGIVYFGIT